MKKATTARRKALHLIYNHYGKNIFKQCPSGTLILDVLFNIGVLSEDFAQHEGKLPSSAKAAKAYLISWSEQHPELKSPASANGKIPENVRKKRWVNKNKKRKPKKQPYAQQSKEFLSSWEWRTLRYEVLQKHGRRCMCCGATPDDGVTVICVDHIKPRHTHPALALDPANLQVLCDVCNQGKGAWDTTDFRDNVVEYDFQCELANKANDSQ